MAVYKRGIASLIIATLAIAGAGSSALGAAPGPVVVGYFANSDVYAGYLPSDIPAGRYTHIDYAFGQPTSGGACALTDPWADYQRGFSAAESVNGHADVNGQKLKGNFNQLRELKAAHPGLKVMISIGGWTLSKYFSDVAATPASRAAFVRSCISLFIKGNLPVDQGAGGTGAAKGVFDGIDIDWEYPGGGGLGGNHHSTADRHNATLLFKEFRRQLDALTVSTGRHHLLTAAIPGGGVAGQHYELAAVGATLDWINVMTYDMHGAWDPWTNFDSPFANAPGDPTSGSVTNLQGTVSYFRSHGVPAGKLVVGIPFYGVQYIDVGAAGHGLYQSFDNSGLGAASGWQGSANPSYRDLVDVGKVVTSPAGGATPQGKNGYQRYWSSAAGEPWLWNPSTARGAQNVSVFISYEDAKSIAERVGLVKSQGLRGLMAWEISQDDGAHDLANAMAKVLH